MELLIAVVAFSVVLAAINAVFYGALRLRNKSVRAIDEAAPLQLALVYLQKDLANLVAPGGLLSGTFQTSKVNSQSSGAPQAMQTAASQPGQGSPELFTTTGVIDENSPFAEVQKVTYFLAPSTNNGAGRDLFRAVTRNLLTTSVEQPVSTPLLSGVESIYFSYHDGTQWRETWDSSDTNQPALPKAIKVLINLAARERGVAPPPPAQLVVPILVDIRPSSTTTTATTSTNAP
jgi:type II secretion system protein J